MASTPTVLFYGQPQGFHPILELLVDDAKFVAGKLGEPAQEHMLLVLDAEAIAVDAFEPLAQLATRSLENNRAVLLLGGSKAHKRALADAGAIHTYIQEASAATLIEPRVDAEGQLTNSRGLFEQFFPQPGEVKGTISAVTSYRDGREEELRTQSAYEPELPEPELEDYEAIVERIRFVVAQLGAGRSLVSEDTSNSMDPPSGVPAGLWYVTTLLINRTWVPNGTKSSNTETPPNGHMSESGNVQVGVYYDNVNTPPQHWVKIMHNGNLQTGGPVHNSSKHRGWSLADYSIQAYGSLEGSYPDGSKIAEDEVSPTNTNGMTQYTSSTQFSVGLEAGTDGLTGTTNYAIGSSESINLTDWALAQFAPAHWQFFQQVPYDGRSSDANDAVDKTKGVKSLPPISLNGTQYNTQTVWIHQPATELQTNIQFLYSSDQHYAAWRSGFWAYHWSLWTYSYSGSFTLDIRFDLVQPDA